MRKLLSLFAVSFCFTWVSATSWTITGANQVFSPDSITISFGDTVIFQIDAADNAQEVGQNTWAANDSIPVTGFQTELGGGMVTGLAPGVHYYVSDSSAWLGMKGRIVVLPAATIQFTLLPDSVLETVDSIGVVVHVSNPSGAPVVYSVAVNPITSTAQPNADYIFNNVTFTDSGTTGTDTVYIDLIDNPFIQSTKTVVLTLFNLSSNALVGTDSIYTLYILNNDTLTFSFLGAAFSYTQADTTIMVGITKSSPVPYNDSVVVVLDSGNAVKGVNFYCPDTITVYFPADIPLADSTDTVYFPVQLFYDSAHVGNVQANFRLLQPPGNSLLGDVTAFTLFIIGISTDGLEPDLVSSTDIKLFPNPAGNRLNIVTDIGWQQVQITDVMGREMIRVGEMSVGNHELDLETLPAGIYLVHFNNEQASYCTKVIKIQADN